MVRYAIITAGLYMYRVDENFMFQRFAVRLRDPWSSMYAPGSRDSTLCTAAHGTAASQSGSLTVHVRPGNQSEWSRSSSRSQRPSRSRTVRENQEQRVHAPSQSRRLWRAVKTVESC